MCFEPQLFVPTDCSWLSLENLQCRFKSGPDCIRKIDWNKAELLVVGIIKLGTDQVVVEDRTTRTWGWIVTENTNHSWVETVGLFWVRIFYVWNTNGNKSSAFQEGEPNQIMFRFDLKSFMDFFLILCPGNLLRQFSGQEFLGLSLT